MIQLTKKNKDMTPFYLNHKKIEKIEGLKDTILIMEDGKKILVSENPEEIVERIIEFESKIIYKSQIKKDVDS